MDRTGQFPYLRVQGSFLDYEEALGFAKSELATTVKIADLAGVPIYKRRSDLDDKRYVITAVYYGLQLIWMFGVSEESFFEPEFPQPEIPPVADPYYSGFVYRGQVRDYNAGSPNFPNFSDYTGWTLSSFAPTSECLKSFGSKLRAGYQEVERLATRSTGFGRPFLAIYGTNSNPVSVPPDQTEPDTHLKDPLGGGSFGYYFSEHNSTKPCMYTGKMAEVVSLLLGYGRWDYDKFQVTDSAYAAELIQEGMRVSYDARFIRSHGVITSSEGNLWIVEISQRLGIIAWKMTYLTIPRFTTNKYYGYPIKSFGGYPDGYCVPYDTAAVNQLIADGKVIELMAPSVYQSTFYTGADEYSPEMSWAFNPDGTEARVTCTRQKEFDGHPNQKCHEYWKVDLSVNDSDPVNPTGSATLTELQSQPLYWPMYENAAVPGEFSPKFFDSSANRNNQMFYMYTDATDFERISIQGTPSQAGPYDSADASTCNSIYSGNKASVVVWVAWVEDHWEEANYILHDDQNGGEGRFFYQTNDYPIWPTDFAGTPSWQPPTSPPYQIKQEFYPGIPKGEPFPQCRWGLDVEAFIQSNTTSWTPTFPSTPPVDPAYPVGGASSVIFTQENIVSAPQEGSYEVGIPLSGGDNRFRAILYYVSFRGTRAANLGVRGVLFDSTFTYGNYRELSILMAAPQNRSALFGFKIRTDCRNPAELDFSDSRNSGTSTVGADVQGIDGYEIATYSSAPSSPTVTGAFFVDVIPQPVYSNPFAAESPPQSSYNGGALPSWGGSLNAKTFTLTAAGSYWNSASNADTKTVTYNTASGPPGNWGPPDTGDFDLDGFTPNTFTTSGGFDYSVNTGPATTTETYIRLQSVAQWGGVVQLASATPILGTYDAHPWAIEGLLPAPNSSYGNAVRSTGDQTITINVDDVSRSDQREAFNGDLAATDIPKIEVEAVLIGHRLPGGGPVLNLWNYTAEGTSFLNDAVAWAWSCAFEGDIDIRDQQSQPQQSYYPQAQVAMWGKRAAIVSDFDDRYSVYHSASIPESFSWGSDVIGPTAPVINTGDSRSLRLLTFIGYNEL